MATYIPVTNIPTQFFDAAGDPLVNGSLEFFLAGTTTATDLFSDDAGTSIGTSITLNALGYPESGGNLITLFRDQSKALKIDCLDSVGATIWTMDDIPATAAFDSTASAKLDLITVTAAIDLDTLSTTATAALPLTGGTLTGNLTMGAGTFLQDSVSAGITASVTQTQGEQPLVSGINEISICANANDTVTLPTTVTGKSVTIINNGANTLQIFPPVSSYIDELAIDTATTIEAGTTAIFRAYNSTQWETVASSSSSIAGDLTVTGNVISDGVLLVKERAAADTDVAAYGQLWFKNSTPNELYFTDDAGTDHALTGLPTFKSYSMRSPTTANGTYWQAGFYDAPATKITLTNASLTQTYGTANVSRAAHAFVVAGAAGTTDGSTMVLTVTGTSITDAGVRTGADSEIIVADCRTSATNQYYETAKKWLGTITYTLSSSGGSTFTYDFNYGHCKYEDFGNRSFTLTDIEVVGLAQANDTGANIQLYKHSSTGWTYSAAAFVPGNTALAGMNTIHSTEKNLATGKYFAFKLSNQTFAVDGTGSEGVLVKITTSTNNSILYLDAHVGVVF